MQDGQPVGASEPQPPPKEAPRATRIADAVKGALAVIGAGALVGVGTLLYNIGRDNGAKDCQAQLDRQSASNDKELAKSERTIAGKEDEIRACNGLNAQLQAVLKLSDADKARLLEIASSEAPVKLQIQGRTPEGLIPVPLGPRNCLLVRFDFENRGSRDVMPAYMNIVSAIALDAEPLGSTHSTGDGFRTELAWGDLLAPGGTRTLETELCPRTQLPSTIPVELTLLSAGFQAKRFKFALTPSK